MYEALINEGHDARLLRFSASEDGTVPGNHQDVKNLAFWQVGCLGITSPCSASCEAAFKSCVDGQNASTALEKTEAFETCIEPTMFESLGCTVDCAPTLGMLSESEAPTESEVENFGAGSGVAGDKPTSSICNM